MPFSPEVVAAPTCQLQVPCRIIPRQLMARLLLVDLGWALLWAASLHANLAPHPWLLPNPVARPQWRAQAQVAQLLGQRPPANQLEQICHPPLICIACLSDLVINARVAMGCIACRAVCGSTRLFARGKYKAAQLRRCPESECHNRSKCSSKSVGRLHIMRDTMWIPDIR